MDRFELRRTVIALGDDEQEVQRAFADFFTKESQPATVRGAEPLGFDATLWAALVDMGAAAMGLPAAAGGDDASLVDLVLVAEQVGRTVAPVPFIAQAVTGRLLARAGAAAGTVAAVCAGERIATLALQPFHGRQLVPDAAVAHEIVTWSPDGLALHSVETPAAHVANQGSVPLAWLEPGVGTRTVLATGPASEALFREAVAEWKTLTAAALVGLADAALQLGVNFAVTRRTLGVPIGSLQGVSHQLADVATGVYGARNLARKAAWYQVNEPAQRPELPLAAFDYAARVATESAWVSAHVQGGLGFTVEADISLYFLRAKGWSALAGDRSADRQEIATTWLART